MPGTRYTKVAKSSWPYLNGVLRGIDADLTELENSAADSTRLNRTVWAVGDSLTQGIAGLSYDSNVAPGIGQPLLHYMAGSWETWALLASEARWTFGGIFATGSYTAAQILSVHVPQLLQVAQPGDTVVVLAGTNGNVLADVKAIHATLHAARLRTVAATIPPSTAAGLAAVSTFNAGIRAYADAQAIPLVDIHATLVDLVTGQYAEALNADGVHPNPLGFKAMGKAFAAVLNELHDPPIVLVDHNAPVPGQLSTKPLALDSPGDGTEWSLFSALGTSTIAPAAAAGATGGQAYKFTVGDSEINARLGLPTFVAGHRYRIGFYIEASLTEGGLLSLRFESNATGGAILFGIGWHTALSLPIEPGRFYIEFTCPTLPDYTYRVPRIFIGGTGSTLLLGETTIQDLTAIGAA